MMMFTQNHELNQDCLTLASVPSLHRNLLFMQEDVNQDTQADSFPYKLRVTLASGHIHSGKMTTTFHEQILNSFHYCNIKIDQDQYF